MIRVMGLAAFWLTAGLLGLVLVFAVVPSALVPVTVMVGFPALVTLWPRRVR